MMRWLTGILATVLWLAALAFAISAFVWTPVYGIPALILLVGLPAVLVARRQGWQWSVVLGAAASILGVLLMIGFTFSIY